MRWLDGCCDGVSRLADNGRFGRVGFRPNFVRFRLQSNSVDDATLLRRLSHQG